MVRLSMRLASVVPAFAVLAGCTAITRMTAPDLVGSPESTGLVVVDSEVEVIAAVLGIRSDAIPVEGVLVRLDGDGGERDVSNGSEVDGLLLFSGLTPGSWQLVVIDADWTAGNNVIRKRLAVPPEAALQFVVDVRAGEPVYLGRVRVEDDARSASRGVRFALDPDPDAEREAWTTLAEVYADTAWASKLASRD